MFYEDCLIPYILAAVAYRSFLTAFPKSDTDAVKSVATLALVTIRAAIWTNDMLVLLPKGVHLSTAQSHLEPH
jgi:hypothetical protein